MEIARLIKTALNFILAVFGMGPADPLPPPPLVEIQAHQATGEPTFSNQQPAGEENSRGHLFKRLGKAIFLIAFVQATTLLIVSQIDTSPFTSLLFIFAMVLAFSTSMAGILLRQESTGMSMVLAELAVVFIALGFLGATQIIVLGMVRWVIWVACASSLATMAVRFLYGYIMHG